MTAGEIVAEVMLRIERRVGRATSRALDKPGSTYITDENLSRALKGDTLYKVAASIRERREPSLTAGLADLSGTARTLSQFFPDSVKEAVAEASLVLSHRITIFDSEFNLGPVIDWHADPATQVKWPFDHFTRMNVQVEPGSDARRVWELNRLHHFTTLGRAFALTGDERYAEEFLIQLASWYEDNPPRFGVNWMVAMEAAIRAINLIAALQLFRGSKLLSDDAIKLILKTLLSHGRFIRSNLEYSNRAPSNHYLSDLIGLFATGLCAPELDEAREWVAFSAPRLLFELERQVYPDGVSYEGSVGYHRLVLEIFTLFFALCRANRIEVPGRYWHRLEAMFDFAQSYIKPDGTAPIIGDSDDGRLLCFKAREPRDHSYLMSIAAVLLEQEKYKQSSRLDQEAVWWFGAEGREAFESLPAHGEEPRSRAFPDAQIFIERSGPLYSIIDCGDHGTLGRGSHAHSDALSLELFAYGHTFLRDPGTYVYSASERWRNLFRSTAYHNTVRIDRRDISSITEGHLFALGPNIKPVINDWQSSTDRDLLDAEHHAYSGEAGGLVHRRAVIFEKQRGFWIIRDTFSGDGRHLFEFFFNFDSGLEVRLEDNLRASARGEHATLAVIVVSRHQFEAEVAPRWISPSYGVREPSSAIIYRLNRSAPLENITLLIPYQIGDDAKVEMIAREFEERYSQD